MTGFDLFMNSKRGQQSSTSQAAVLVLVIGLLIVAYLILLPKDAREDVLKGEDIDFDDYVDGNNNGDSNNDETDEESELLLLRNPGNLVPSGIADVEKEFASVHLFDRLEVETQNLADRVLVSRSLFKNDFEDLEFTVENEENLEKLSLFFNVV